MEANARLAQYEKEVASLRSDRKLLKKHCKELVDQQTRREEHLSALRALLLPEAAAPSSDEGDLAAVQALVELRDELVQLRDSHSQVLALRDDLQGQVQAKELALAEASARGAERAKQTENLEEDRRKLTGDLMAAHRELQEAQVRVSDAGKRAQTDEALIQSLREEMQGVRDALAAAQEQNQMAARDKAQLEADLENRDRDLHESSERLQRELERRAVAESSSEKHREAAEELKRKQTNAQIEYQEKLTAAAHRAEQALEGQIRAEQERRGLEDRLRSTEAALAEASKAVPPPPPAYEALETPATTPPAASSTTEGEEHELEEQEEPQAVALEEGNCRLTGEESVEGASSEITARVQELEEELRIATYELDRLRGETETLRAGKLELAAAQEEGLALATSLNEDLTAARREKDVMTSTVTRAEEEAQAMATLLASERLEKERLEAQISELESASSSVRAVGKWYEEKWSSEDNKVYYVDHDTKTTHWSLPPGSPIGPEGQGDQLPPSEQERPSSRDLEATAGSNAAAAENGEGSGGHGDEQQAPRLASPESDPPRSSGTSSGADTGLDGVLASLALSHMSGALAVAGVRTTADLLPGPKHPTDEQIMQQAGLNKVQVAKLRKAAAQRQAEERVQRRDPDERPTSPGASVVEFTNWRRETQDNPVPPFGIGSPVIQHLLASWTSDPQKLRYVSLWLSVLINEDPATPVPESFPSGLQLIGLKPEIKDGFLTLIVPMLKHRHEQCVVHTRMEGADRWGLKIKVVPKLQAAESPATTSQGGERAAAAPAPGRSSSTAASSGPSSQLRRPPTSGPQQQEQQRRQQQEEKREGEKIKKRQTSQKPTRESILERFRAATSSTLSISGTGSAKNRPPAKGSPSLQGPASLEEQEGAPEPNPSASLANRISQGLANLDMDEF
uniref:WW domain-containing protein n=1 Tax=Rhizochromulina marina TaxID=1034831 RepID=A0A7S2SIB0_9STRA|mmetsp:Transcript_30651/g.89092  ORF Transcript_30651/g.89092 Transcript_30651/m.89092 type:complete len:915 (+) Transcript_30651:173-2917(+)